MDGWQPALGAAMAWLLVTAAGTAAGVGVVSAWSRWGSSMPMPGRVRAVVERALGAVAPAATSAVLTIDPAALQDLDPATVAPPVPRHYEIVPTPPEQPLAGPPGEAPRAGRTSRTEALEELSALLSLSYEKAVALLDAGLWGLDNLEEWTRSMRSGTSPEGLDPALLDLVLALPLRELEPRLVAFRERRGAMRALETLWGVGPEEAARLYDAGFTDLQAIQRSSTDKLAKVEGIGVARAFQIRAAAFGLAPTP